MDVHEKGGELALDGQQQAIAECICAQGAPVSPEANDQHGSLDGCGAVAVISNATDENQEAPVDGERNATPLVCDKRKKRRRRARKRRWKPYFKLSAEERQALEVREEKRAERLRALRFAKGIPVAPYNTTQFLLDDRQQRDDKRLQDVDVIVDTIRQRTVGDTVGDRLSDSMTTTESATSSGDDFSQIEEEFQNEYESAHAERLESMTRTQLVAECVRFNKELENMYELVASLRRQNVQLKQHCLQHGCPTIVDNEQQSKVVSPTPSCEEHPP